MKLHSQTKYKHILGCLKQSCKILERAKTVSSWTCHCTQRGEGQETTKWHTTIMEPPSRLVRVVVTWSKHSVMVGDNHEEVSNIVTGSAIGRCLTKMIDQKCEELAIVCSYTNYDYTFVPVSISMDDNSIAFVIWTSVRYPLVSIQDRMVAQSSSS